MAQSSPSFQDTVRELWELLKAYARQETIDPLRPVGRRIGFGIAGSLLFSVGWILVALGTVRFLQTHTLPGAGDWLRVHDWSVYLVGLAVLAIGIAGALRKVFRPDPGLALPERAGDRERPPLERSSR